MIRSMTGYAYLERSGDARDITIEVRSVNNRYLEIYASLPTVLSPLDPEIRKIVAERALRGKVEISLRLREYEDTVSIHVDHTAVAAARRALDEIASTAGISTPPTYSDILAFEGIVHTDRKRDLEQYRQVLFPLLEQALDQWDRTRLAEGAITVEDIRSQLKRLDESATVFASRAADVEEVVFKTVRDKFREILGDEADEQRIYAEAAMLAIKHGTNEEIVRLKSHLDSLRALLKEGGSIGKRLDFVCQEINREVNTTGSKTIFPDVQDAVVQAKDAVEAIREQVRNIE